MKAFELHLSLRFVMRSWMPRGGASRVTATHCVCRGRAPYILQAAYQVIVGNSASDPCRPWEHHAHAPSGAQDAAGGISTFSIKRRILASRL